MTEAEWAACTDLASMLPLLRGKVSDRKLRLFTVACCRRVAHLLTDRRSREAVTLSARFAEGHASRSELARAAENAARAWRSGSGQAAGAAAWAADPYGDLTATALAAAREAAWAVWATARGGAVEAWDEERLCQAALLRDVCGNPFRPVAIDPAWLHRQEADLLRLARAIYERGHFGDLPVLGDALEEAGCTNEEILSHCRRPGEHTRGCWVVDALLGKS